MINSVVLVGRITKDPELHITETSKTNVANITVAVPRSYKNANDEYDTDFIRVTLWKTIAENTVKYIKKGDLIGIEGRIQNNRYKDKEGNDQYAMEVVADKVVFLSNKKEGGE